ncbi:MAG: SusE domain-containing protein [Bacteroidales bacterium]
MKNRILILLTLIGLTGLFTSCENDGEKIVISSNPIPPALLTVPDLTLERANATDTLVFEGSVVDPGFTASATYILEACASGTDFEDVIRIYSGTRVEEIKITVSELNTIMLKKFPADQASDIDLRIRAMLVVDAGTGAPGTSSQPMEYFSDIVAATVTVFGLPRLDLIDSGMDQKIESSNGDGVYSGFVKVDPASPFTLLDPDAEISYGASGDALVVDGSGLAPDDAGWHKLTVNTNDLTYTLEAYMIGLVGSATPNGWDSPDQKMEYDSASDTWKITIDLVDGDIKFRLNDGWAWNMGGSQEELTHDGPNITVTAGNFTITLTVTNYTQGSETGTFTIVQNS